MKKLFKRLKENKKGFSLVELIVVIAIMAILVGVLGVTFIPYIERSREGTDIDTLGKVKSIVEPVILTDENFKTDYAGKIFTLDKIKTDFPIVAESLTEDVAAKCTCDENLACYIAVTAEGKVIAYFSADENGASAFTGKSGDPLTTGGTIPTP